MGSGCDLCDETAHLDRKLRRNQVFETNITSSVGTPSPHFARDDEPVDTAIAAEIVSIRGLTSGMPL